MRNPLGYALFLTVFSALVAGVHAYLDRRLVQPLPTERARRIGRRVVWASGIGLPLGMFAAAALPRSLSAITGPVTFGWMALVILALFLALSSEPLRLGRWAYERFSAQAPDPARRAFFEQGLAGGVGFASLGIGGYGLVEARTPQIVRVTVKLKRLPAALSGFRIAQLSDVHIGPLLDGAWLDDVVRRVNAESPDLVAITGDLVDGRVADLAEHVAPIMRLASKHGTFFVTGNHEYYSGADAWIAELGRIGVRVLRNERVAIGEGPDGFDLAGVDDFKAHQFGGGHGADLARAVAGRDESRELVLLAHQPKEALRAVKLGVGLQLSGHTHGGQIWPFGLFVKLDQPFVAGLDTLGELQVYTSRGTGYWGPPVRVAAPPEITIVTLERA